MAEIGILLVGHGTRSSAGTRCVEFLRNLVADRSPQLAVSHCFLELHEKTIERGLSELTKQGVSKVAVAPLLLFAAGHAKADIPREAADAAAPHLQLCQADALGCHPALVELSQRRYREAVDSSPEISPEQTCLLLVGRGSYDDEATAELRKFADLRRSQLPGVTIQVAFIAMAQPSVAEALERLSGSGFKRVVVQPHLLFPGELLDNLAALVNKQQSNALARQWILTPALAHDLGAGGPADTLLVTTVLQRAAAALQTLGAG